MRTCQNLQPMSAGAAIATAATGARTIPREGSQVVGGSVSATFTCGNTPKYGCFLTNPVCTQACQNARRRFAKGASRVSIRSMVAASPLFFPCPGPLVGRRFHRRMRL